MTRKILHLDLDAFFCAVEEQRDPTLIGRPFAVGGKPNERGVVASCSYAARKFGVRSAMPMARALQLCPKLVIVSSHHGVYSEISRQVMDKLKKVTLSVEQISIDEAFLDVTSSSDPGEVQARNIQKSIRDELGLPCSLGVATNKLLAKTANDVGKAAARGSGPPNAITVVPPGEEASFLAPLPVDALWGIGPKTAARLEEIGLRTIGDLAKLTDLELIRMFGKSGYDLAQRAKGIDNRPIVTEHETKSISQETTFARDVRDGRILRKTLLEQSESVGQRLREANLCGTTIKLKIRWPDFTTLTRQQTLDHSTNQDQEIFTAIEELFNTVWQKGKPVRLIGVGVSGLGPPIRQLSLWDYDSEKENRLQEAVDILRQRFGSQVIQRGSHVRGKGGTSMEKNNG